MNIKITTTLAIKAHYLFCWAFLLFMTIFCETKLERIVCVLGVLCFSYLLVFDAESETTMEESE